MQSTIDVRLALNHLIQTCKDGQEGFLTAAENVNSEDVRRLLSELSLQRAGFAGELQQISHELGDPSPEYASSVAGTFHRGWMNLKTAILGRDAHSILTECERGEKAAVSEYEQALGLDLPDYIRKSIAQQHGEIGKAHQRIQALAQSAGSSSNEGQ
ncbi:MAG TPA: PA2169 family four-helix-bundle protein [Chthoniobacter sp.]|jgi:uncharacterized protein (TIGR02284 family)